MHTTLKFRKAGKLAPLYIIVFLSVVITSSYAAYLTCAKPPAGSTHGHGPAIFDFGAPIMFVTSESQHFYPYSLVDNQRRTSILSEYIMAGYRKIPGKSGVHENLHMVIFDGVKSISSGADFAPDLIHQNLEKEQYWRFFNSTGVYPWMALVNVTSRKQIPFHAALEGEGNVTTNIKYTANLIERSYLHEPQVPFDATFEIPGNSKVLKSEKTLVQYQSFSLWRWKLSNKTARWIDVMTMEKEPSTEKFWSNDVDFKRIENPCTKDMFLLYTIRNSGSKSNFFLASPLIQSHLREDWFYDMSSDDLPWSPNSPKMMILSNDHIVILTNNSLWISQSLNDTTIEDDLAMKTASKDRPALQYFEVNPCAGFEDSVGCFLNSSENSTSEYRLFYNPVCYLYQAPEYYDYITFLIKNEQDGQSDFTVLFSAKPYKDWLILFHRVFYYQHFDNTNGTQEPMHYHIKNIIGLIYNHHTRKFDITLEVYDKLQGETSDSMQGNETETTPTPNSNYTTPTPNSNDTIPTPNSNYTTPTPNANDANPSTPTFSGSKFIRFSLRVPSSGGAGHGITVEELRGGFKRELSGTRGLGNVDFVFPKGFTVENVVMNGLTQDIFFLGNQLWIAEAGAPHVYQAVAGIKYEMGASSSNCPFGNSQNETEASGSKNTKLSGKIRECSFNHPDRVYVCMSENRNFLIAGKIGSTYSPVITRIEDIMELQDKQIINGWSTEYMCEIVQKTSVFVAGYSGKIVMWYIHDPAKNADAVAKLVANSDDDAVCKPKTLNERICACFRRLKEKSCTGKTDGPSFFRVALINPANLVPRNMGLDGPLVPFFVDSESAVLFEGIVPEMETKDETQFYTYLSGANIGQKIYCDNYDLLKKDSSNPALKHSCELFIRHGKVVTSYLDGFTRAWYVRMLKSPLLYAVPTDIVVLVQKRSNMALIKINDHINEPAWTFSEEHIGQTLYLPGNFSILLTGFPMEDSKQIMQGYTTRYCSYEVRVVVHAFFSFLLDLSTSTFREVMIKNGKMQNKTGEKSPEEIEREADMLTVKDNERNSFFPASATKGAIIKKKQAEESDLFFGRVEYDRRTIWHLEEGQCDFIITLMDNPVLKSHGGRISLDLHDKITFEVQMKAITPTGKLMTYRPLLVVTNSNPNILRVNKKEKLSGNPQRLTIMLSPTGYQQGISVVSIRSIVDSLQCERTTSITLVVLVHRDVGRRLHINYPIPQCKPQEQHGMYPRLWYQDPPGCISRNELLSKKREISRYRGNREHVSYITLPPNYRPPSFSGASIPTSKNIYNADPSKPPYKSWYKVSRESFEYLRCKDKTEKSECACIDNDRLTDDEGFTECKEKVFFTQRTGGGKPLEMSAAYDGLMRDEDQEPELFSAKINWSVTIEEVNGRSEWYVGSPSSPYLTMINSRLDLSEGQRHYDMNSFSVGLLGTGLFHFKVALGRFETFGETTGYFMVYVATNEFNHLHLFMIVLGTIIFCMTMVFLGFISARKRLSGMLPIQPVSNKRKLKLL